MCAQKAWRLYQGGSAWSGSAAYIAFGRDYIGLAEKGVISDELYAKYLHWENLAKISGFRFMHKDFCIISDRPLEYHVLEDGTPHNDTGPFVRWSDGTALYALNGHYVSQQIVEAPETITAQQVLDEQNAETRRHMLARYGGKRDAEAAGAWLKDIGAEPVSTEDITDKMSYTALDIWRTKHGDTPVLCKLYKAEMPSDDPLWLLWVVCTSTAKEVFLEVGHPEAVEAHGGRCDLARLWTFPSAWEHYQKTGINLLRDAIET